MADEEDNAHGQTDLDHQAAFIFQPLDDASTDPHHHSQQQQPPPRPTKRRRVTAKRGTTGRKSKATNETKVHSDSSSFVPLFNAQEPAHCTALRQQIFQSSWSAIEDRIQHNLREANRTTLEEVYDFVANDLPARAAGKMPAAYIITGPNTASQRLLFEQLGDSLAPLTGSDGGGGVVCVRAVEARDLKGTLKVIISRALAIGTDDEEEGEVAVAGGRRRYLDYDLEALHAHLKTTEGGKRVFVAFQDTEAFDTSLLSDLISLMDSWRDRIEFTLLFGIATSVELFQVRLLKSTAQRLYGKQFDVVQASSVLESVFKAGVAHESVGLRLGPGLLRGLIERQMESVAGVQGFISSVKYAYMCHFYANPLSVLLGEEEGTVTAEHLEAVRMLDSFGNHVEAAVDAGRLSEARGLLESDEALSSKLLWEMGKRRQYSLQLLRSIHVLMSTKIPVGGFVDLYTSALADGIDLTAEGSTFGESVKRMQPEEVISLITWVLDAIREGNEELGLTGWADQTEGVLASLMEMGDEITSLAAKAKEEGNNLRSKYSAQSRVMRTTVVAQKVQLSQDTAKLTPEDKAFTDAIDKLVNFLSQTISCEPLDNQLFHEIWTYDCKSPNRDVFIPRLGTSIERALSRPHDYLGCECCSKADGEMTGNLPATAILYHLYVEAGALINVADLWSAYYSLVGGEGDDEDGVDERETLVRFYQALAELKTMGFVKQSKKKADHIAKLKWM